MMGLRGERVRRARIPQHDVGVAARGDGPLPREQAHDLRRRRRGEVDPAARRDAALGNATVEEERHPRLDARRAVRDLGEVALPQLLLLRQSLEALLHAERAVIGGHDLKVVALESFPELVLMPRRAQRR